MDYANRPLITPVRIDYANRQLITPVRVDHANRQWITPVRVYYANGQLITLPRVECISQRTSTSGLYKSVDLHHYVWITQVSGLQQSVDYLSNKLG